VTSSTVELNREGLRIEVNLFFVNEVETRLLRLFAIDEILTGRIVRRTQEMKAPMLLGMGAVAKLLGVSGAMLWRRIMRGSAADSLVCYCLAISMCVPIDSACTSDAFSTMKLWLSND
jgi:hypothetical protein